MDVQPMDIKQATAQYEAWLRSRLSLVIEKDLDFKHQQMAAAVFPFLRATFYRWAQLWARLCSHLDSSPTVLGVGDLHVENYGTWRDAEGRLVWGINDFDEATVLPYAADLVRLAASAALATGEHHLSIVVKEAAGALLDGYREALAAGGEPFVLAERHPRLRRLASGELRDPVRFWTKMQALPDADPGSYPRDAVATLVSALPGPDPAAAARFCARRAGLGSLGRPRLVGVRHWDGSCVAREVKAMLPSAWDWAMGQPDGPVRYRQLVDQAVRGADPYSTVERGWLVRRLAPDCARIELADLPVERDEAALVRSMGFEVANIHVGTPGAAAAILDDLDRRAAHHPDWLASAAQRMADATAADWESWRA